MTDSTERSKVSAITYVNAKTSEEFKSPESNANIVRTKFSNGHLVDVDLSTLDKGIQRQAMLQGLSIKLQRSFASAKGNVEEAIESFETVLDNIRNGLWNTKREGSGPRLSILAEAVEAMLVAAGQTVDETRRAAIIEKLKADDVREATMKDAKVKAHYERIKAERAAERASKAASEASNATSTAADLF